jgi:hypothetical protein
VAKTIGIDLTDGYYCKVFGQVHSVNDSPARVHLYSRKFSTSVWYWRGVQHRGDDQPAATYDRHGLDLSYLSQFDDDDHDNESILRDEDDCDIKAKRALEWVSHGKYWRADGKPTVEYNTGRKEWRNAEGRRHRADDLPAIIDPVNRRIVWYMHGNLHRDNYKPSYVEMAGFCAWYCNGRKYMMYDNFRMVPVHEDEWFGRHAITIPENFRNYYELSNIRYIVLLQIDMLENGWRPQGDGETILGEGLMADWEWMGAESDSEGLCPLNPHPPEGLPESDASDGDERPAKRPRKASKEAEELEKYHSRVVYKDLYDLYFA